MFEVDSETSQIIKKVGELLRDPKLLDYIIQDLDLTVKHDYNTKISVFITACSAYTNNPLNLFLKGESSIGKTYNVTEVLKYFPEEDVWFLGRLSPTALIHERGILVDENGAPINFAEAPRKEDFEDKREYHEARRRWNERIRNAYHLVDLTGKILVFLEAPPLQTFNMLLPILSHDKHEIDYRITEKTGKGQLQTLRTVIRGWPATIFCTTSTKYLDDLATRTFTVSPETTRDKFREANLVTAKKNACPWLFDEERFELKVIRYLIRNFKAAMENYNGVVVPFAESLAETYFAEKGRDMRDFKNFMEYVKVLTALHFAQRPELEIGDKKYLVAQLADFAIAQKIFFTIFESTRTNLPAKVLDFYHKILVEKEVWEADEAADVYNKVFPDDTKTTDTIRRYLSQLSDAGYVDVREHPESKRKNIYVVFRKEKWEKTRFFESPISLSLEFKNSVEKWLNEYGKKFVFYIKNIDDLGEIHKFEASSNDQILENILLYKTDFIPNCVNRFSGIKMEKSIIKTGKIENPEKSHFSSEKKTETKEIKNGGVGPIPLQGPIITFTDSQTSDLDTSRIVRVDLLKQPYKGWCDGCCQDHSKKVVVRYKAETFDGGVMLLCEDCAREVMKALRERDET